MKEGDIVSIRTRSEIPAVRNIERLLRPHGAHSVLRYEHRAEQSFLYEVGPTWTDNLRFTPCTEKVATLSSMDILSIRDAVVSGRHGVYFGEGETCIFPFFRQADVALVGDKYKSSKRLRLRLTASNIHVRPDLKGTMRRDLNPVRTIEQPVIFFGTPGDNAYSHFLWDAVTTLWWLDHLGKDLKVLASSDMPPYQREILAAYGVPESRIIWRSQDEDVRVNRLFVASNVAVNNRWARDEGVNFLQKVSKKKGLFRNRRLFLDRGGERSSMRRLLNEEQLWEICSRYDFERITPGKLSFQEKIHAFRDAAVVVGQYGGGMQTQFLYPPGTSIICLHSNMFVRDILDFTSEALQLKVSNVVGTAFPRAVGDPNNSDFLVDPLVFEKALKRVTRERTESDFVSTIARKFVKMGRARQV